MLPLSLLRAAKGSPILVELKSGETYNGRLASTDAYMNLNLAEVICTSSTGDRFWKIASCSIRGSAIKYLRLPEQCLEAAEEEDAKQQQQQQHHGGRGGRGEYGRGRGRFGDRGRGRGGGRGRGRGRGSGRGSGRNNHSSAGRSQQQS